MNKKYNLVRSLLFASVMLLSVSCSDDDDFTSINTVFDITSEQIGELGITNNVRVPNEGGTYNFNIIASPEVTWSVTTNEVVGGDWLLVDGTGEHQGEGKITVTAISDTDGGEPRTGSVVITNLKTKISATINFEQKDKDILIPDGWKDETEFDFGNEETRFGYYYVETKDVVLFWEKSFGPDPTKYSVNTNDAFDPIEAINQTQEGFDFMVDVAGFANRTTSCAAKNKILVVVHCDTDGTSNKGGAVGYGRPGVGIFELSSNRLKKNPYGYMGVMHHELCHCFQYISHYDGSSEMGWSGPIYEMTSQWSLLRKFSDWGHLEPSHAKDFLKATYKAFMHKDNQYHSPYVLEYWEMKHDKNMVSYLWKSSKSEDNKDIVEVYKRVTGIDQETFNDEMFDACRRFVTWDIPRIDAGYDGWKNIHCTKLDKLEEGKYRISVEQCPQNYGYNAIKMDVPEAGTVVRLNFNGSTELPGFPIQNRLYRGWRYGFLAVANDGTRTYGDMYKENQVIEFTVPENTQYLWFVVMGAPTTHWKFKEDNEGHWPYEFTVEGTKVSDDANDTSKIDNVPDKFDR